MQQRNTLLMSHTLLENHTRDRDRQSCVFLACECRVWVEWDKAVRLRAVRLRAVRLRAVISNRRVFQ